MDSTNGINLIELGKKSQTPEMKDIVMHRISEIVDTLSEDNEIFKKIDKPKLMESLSILVDKAPEKLISITDDELRKRIRRIIVIEATAGMLQDLTSEEMKAFKEAVRRRNFFE